MNDAYLYVEFPTSEANEALARMIAASFTYKLNPTMDDIRDIKTAVSEAVTNCCIHAYPGYQGMVIMKFSVEHGDTIVIEITDHGVGIPNLEEAMQPLYTTRPDLERSGMGFSFMEAHMDYLRVSSGVGVGTTVTMWKTIR